MHSHNQNKAMSTITFYVDVDKRENFVVHESMLHLFNQTYNVEIQNHGSNDTAYVCF